MLDNSGGGGDGGGSGGAASLAAEEVVVGVENGGEGEEERGKGEGGNRWPREETLALLKIRADMDLAFRDSTLKAPLWDEVSRKLGELGYHRNARKCKEKFENIFKYHKRTKECRSGRQNGKNYRFFEQLDRFDNQPSLPPPSSNQFQTYAMETTPLAVPIYVKPTTGNLDFMVPHPSQNANMEFMIPSTSTTSSSGGESEGSVKKKRKLRDYFEKLMKEVLEKQENLQNHLLEAMEKCEKDRMAREEAWRLQQMDRFRKEQEYLAHERAITAARDATVMAFLQKISEQAIPVRLPESTTPVSDKHINKQKFQTPTSLSTPANIENQELENIIDRQEDVFDKDVDRLQNGVGDNSIPATTSRWPKTEVEALIRLRTNFGMQYQDNGVKGPLWEGISSAMEKLGYDRSAKRCKEKWENINKYYKRVKESHKRRPESSKTCPYFHLLESLYEKKSKRVEENPDWSGNNLKPEHILMQMMGQQEEQLQQQQSFTEDDGSENVDQNTEGDAMEEEDDENGDGYRLVVNHPSSVASME